MAVCRVKFIFLLFFTKIQFLVTQNLKCNVKFRMFLF